MCPRLSDRVVLETRQEGEEVDVGQRPGASAKLADRGARPPNPADEQRDPQAADREHIAAADLIGQVEHAAARPAEQLGDPLPQDLQTAPVVVTDRAQDTDGGDR